MAKNSKNTEKNTENSQNNANSGEGYIVSGLQDIVEYGKQISYIYKTEGASLDLVDAAQKAALKAHWQYLDHKLGNKLTGMAKKMAIELATKDAIDPKTGKQMSVWELEDFLRKHNTSTQELEAFWYTLQIEAEHLFDSFMLFVERKRGIKSKFYYPRREVLWKHGVVQALQDLEDDKLDLLALSLAPGTGKGEPLYAKVLTPDGFITMSEVEVGTKVISPYGKFELCVATVIGVFPHNNMEVYEITLENGKKCRCDTSHLWDVLIDGAYRTIDMNTILDKIENHKIELPVADDNCFYAITKTEFIDFEPTKCIYLDSPSHLYITDDYIITHNTSIEKFFAAWVMGRHVIDYSLFYSHSDDITRMFYDGVVDITTNETEYQYHECWLAKPMVLYGVNAKKQTINFNSYKPFASIQTTSVGAKNAGKVRCNRYLYCDDLVSGIEEALNKNRLDKLWDAYSVDARQRMIEGCKEIHIATRWSVHDVIGRLERIHEGDERARFLNIPCYDEYGQSNFQYAYNGFSTKFFKEQQAIMDEISFNALYMGQPIEREGLLYNKDEMRYYTELPDREPDAVIGVCDTKSKGTDYMFAPCFYQYDNDYYLVNCVCDDTTNYSIQYGKITDLICDNNMKQIEFESNAGGDRVAFEVDKMVKARGRSCNVTTKPTETNKETRIITYSDWIKRNVVFRSQEMYTRKSDYGEMMYWLFAYTQTGKNPHDDVPDGLANFAKFVERKYNVRPTMIRNSPLM